MSEQERIMLEQERSISELEYKENDSIDDNVIELPPTPITMSELIKLCITNKPKDVIIEPDYPELTRCHRLLTLLTEGKEKSCLSLWSALKPEYDIDENTIYFKTKNVKKQGPIGFRAEIDEFGFTEAINNEAQKIHESLDRVIKKKHHRIELFFYCLYQAHKSLNKVIMPEEVAERVKLPIGSISKANNIVKPIQFNMRSPTRRFTYSDYVGLLLDEFKLDSRLIEIVQLPIHNMLEVHPLMINEYKPQRIALAAIIYFHRSNGIIPPDPLPKCMDYNANKDIIKLLKIMELCDRP